MHLMFWCALLLSSLTFASEGATQRVRHVAFMKDQIVEVRTAIGIATIVQVPDRPNSVVVGDQDSFKVEYLDQAITIKPVRAGAKSNLYVYTDWQRYNVQLVTGPERAADFVVYLDHPKEKSQTQNQTIKWYSVNKSAEQSGLKLEVSKLSATPEMLLIQFEVTASLYRKLEPSWFWLVQETNVRPINNLVLSAAEVNRDSKINGMIQVKRGDLNPKVPFQIELRMPKKLSLTIPKVNSWRL